MELALLNQVAEQIKSLMLNARMAAAREINAHLLKTYWEVGRVIVEHEQDGNIKAQYGTRLLAELAKELARNLGKGFSRSNLQNMRNFYIAYSNLPDASGKLTWSHFCELINISDTDARAFYEQECVDIPRWSVRELKRQINTSLFERLLLSDGNVTRKPYLPSVWKICLLKIYSIPNSNCTTTVKNNVSLFSDTPLLNPSRSFVFPYPAHRAAPDRF